MRQRVLAALIGASARLIFPRAGEILWRSLMTTVVIAFVCLLFIPAQAGSVQIVALGASNTAGKGVASPWPARLEAMLRA